MITYKILETKETIKIDENKNFIFKGGEATIYSHKDIVLKIYHDKNKMVPLEKIKELSVLDKKNIINPKNILLNNRDEMVGFTMSDVSNNTLPIMRLFNTIFWKTKKLNVNKIIKIIEFMQETLIYIHRNKCLVVDFNVLNFLIDTFGYSIIYFIDTCAWKTKSFPPMAISPFIKDYSKNYYDELTDLYSFAIVSFQLLIGIHPFKGTHPKYGITKDDTIKRMKENASVYDKGVGMNSAVRDFSIIPLNYNQWFKDLFLYGKRTFPPGTAGVVTAIRIDKIVSKENLVFSLYKEFDEEIIFYKYIFGKEIIFFKDSIKIDEKIYKNCTGDIIFDNELNPYEIKKEDNYLLLKDLNNNINEKTNIKIDDFLFIDNELYCKREGDIFHVKIKKAKKLLVLIQNRWNIMQYSSEIFNGIIYENILGRCWFFIPVHQNNWGVTKNIKELDDYRIIECERKENILIVIGKNENGFKKFIIKFNREYNKYKIIDQKNNIDIINFVVLDNGLVVNLEENKIEIFEKEFDKNKIKIVNDDIISMLMINRGNEVLLIEDKKLMKISIK